MAINRIEGHEVKMRPLKCNCTPPSSACSICQGKKPIRWRMKVNDEPKLKSGLTLREELWACQMELESERQINASRLEEIKSLKEKLEEFVSGQLKASTENEHELKAKVQELEAERDGLHAELFAMTQAQEGLVISWNKKVQELENFLDDVFDSAYECNIDRPWRNLFQDYCEANAKKTKKEQGL